MAEAEVLMIQRAFARPREEVEAKGRKPEAKSTKPSFTLKEFEA